jgi:hypothetical protein
MILLESYNLKEFARQRIVELNLPKLLWEKTGGLPAKIKEMLSSEPINQEIISEFIDRVMDQRVRRLDELHKCDKA